MNRQTSSERWGDGSAYEAYMGRWSRRIALDFAAWLGVAPGSAWLDVGCGTGALSQVLLQTAAPVRVVGIDASAQFIAHARGLIDDARVSFEVGDAETLGEHLTGFDAVVAGLVLNHVSDPARAIEGMTHAARPGAVIGAYVWDYADQMELNRYFWDAATALDPAAAAFDEGRQVSICNPDALQRLFSRSLEAVQTSAIVTPTLFEDFDDYWSPFMDGAGTAPRYVRSLEASQRDALRDALRGRLPIAGDGSISLEARAWAAKGQVPGSGTPMGWSDAIKGTPGRLG